MEKKQKTSLTWQLILTMVVIVAGTVAMCWFFNTTFLEKYYIFHKEKELKSSFDQVRLICEKQGDSSDDAYVQFERICANKTGGMSGPAIHPVAVRMVYQTAQAVKIPIIGMGGIMNAADAIEMILAGATAVSVGTANFRNPAVTMEIVEGIERYMEKYHVSDIKELIGAVSE